MKTKQHFTKDPQDNTQLKEEVVKEPSSVESSNSSMDTAQQPSHTTINSEASIQTSDNEENSAYQILLTLK